MISHSGKCHVFRAEFYLLILISLCIIQSINSQPLGTPYIKNFDRNQYKAGTQNWQIGSADQGFLYFGNNKGLLEYDGTNWKTFKLPNYSIARSFAFVGDSIFVGGQNEFGYLKCKNKGELQYYSLSSNLPENTPPFDDIWRIFNLKEQVFFCSEEVLIVYKDGHFSTIKPMQSRFENFFEVNGQIIVQELSQGLFHVNEGKLEIIPGSQIFGKERVVSMIPSRDAESVIIITRNGDMYRQTNDVYERWQTTSSEYMKSSKPYCAIRLKDGDIAIGTSQNGLIIIDDLGTPKMVMNKSNGMQNNTVLSLYQDIHNNLWLGLDNGIDYIEINSSFRKIGPESGIQGTGYTSFLHSGTLYFGTNLGLFHLPWKEDRNPLEKKEFKLINDGIGQIWHMDKVYDHLIISRHEGAYIADGERLKQFSDIQGSWKLAELKKHPGYAIQGTYTGFNIYKKEKQSFLEHASLEGFSESARVFEEDQNGRIWVSHAYKGLFSLELSDDLRSITKLEVYDSTDGLPNNLFINVSRLRNEVLFTSTAGIYRFDAENQVFVEHEDLSNIFGKGRDIHRMIEDQLGNIWFSIDNEFGVLTIEEKGVFNDYEVHYFNQIQKTLVDGFEDIYALDEENVFIGTESGFVHFNPLKSEGKDINFTTYIREISLITDGDSTLYIGNGSNSGEVVSNEFAHYQDDFRFSFSSPYYEKKDYIEYRYKLKGFENKWSDWSGTTQKEYTNLKAGSYEFSVQARNAYSSISSPDSFAFVINPPWYFNTFMKITYVFVGILLFGLGLRGVYLREARKRYLLQLNQEKEIADREQVFKKEFEKSENEIVKLRNEKLMADVSHKNSQLASATMHLVQKSELLISLKNEVKSLVKEAPQDFRKRLQHIARAIDDDIQLDNNWEQFEHYFDQVHENFFKRLRQKYPNLTPKDQKLCAYLRMNLSTKEIAPLLNISVRGVEISRYRLRKKLELDANSNLVAHIIEI